METISLKVDENMLKKMDKLVADHNFGTRTEFVREAIRKNMDELSRDDLLKEFLKLKGVMKHKRSRPEDDWKMKEEAGKELLKVLEKRFG